MFRKLLIACTIVMASTTVAIADWSDVVDKVISNAPAPPPPPMPSSADTPSGGDNQGDSAPVPGVDDQHYIQRDDYFIQNKGLGQEAWIYVDVAKMVTPPSAETKREAEFMKIKDGQNMWTKHYWKTRIASRNELRMGMHVIAFNDNQRGDVYVAPENKSSSRGGAWFYAKITDTSDMYRGYVTVSGNYKVGLKNLRLILR